MKLGVFVMKVFQDFFGFRPILFYFLITNQKLQTNHEIVNYKPTGCDLFNVYDTFYCNFFFIFFSNI